MRYERSSPGRQILPPTVRSLNTARNFVRRLPSALLCWPVLLLLACTVDLPPARGQTLATLLTNGPTDRRINLVIMSEGYTSAKLASTNTSGFQAGATNLVNLLLGAVPFNQYRSCFNVFTIAVASNENGSDHPSQGTYADTYFSTSYDSYGNPMFINLPPDEWDPDPAHGIVRVTALINSLMPGGLPILLVNDLAYGGSGGSVLICSRAPGSDTIVTHEMGHTLAGLGDEYEDAFPGYPDTEEPNTTRTTNLAQIKWNAWIIPGTQIPTAPYGPHADRVGLFEGAHYHATGWYRPRVNCRMRELTEPFCEVCQEALVLSFYRKVRPIESFTPAATNLLSTTPQTLAFTVATLPPPAGVPVIQWALDNTAVTGATQTNFQVSSGTTITNLRLTIAQPVGTTGVCVTVTGTVNRGLSNGLHQVRAEVRDATPLVRTDANQLLRQTNSWQLQVSLASSPAVVLEATTNLLNWQPVVTNSFTQGRFEFQEPIANPLSRRYYRARVTP